MKKLIVLLFSLFMLSASAYAFDDSDFRRHINEEIIVKVVTCDKGYQITMQLLKVTNGVLTGRTNRGTVYVEIEDVLFFYRQKPGVRAVYNRR